MLTTSITIVALTAALLGIVGANNAGNAAGTIAGSRILSYRHGIMVFILGLTLGALLEGGKLSGAIQGRALEGALGTRSVAIVLIVTIAMVIIATGMRLPLPITQAVFGAAIGAGIYQGIAVDARNILLVVVSWALTPFAAAAVSFVISRVLRHRSIGSVSGAVVVYGAMTIIASFYTSYSFGANTLGLIMGIVKDDLGWAAALILAVAATSVGGLVAGEAVSKTIGERLANLGPQTAFASQVSGAFIVHLFTQQAVPTSISHSIIGGVSGGGAEKGVSALSRDTTIKLVALWITTPLFSLMMAMLLHAVS